MIPNGLVYRPDFITAGGEQKLLGEIAGLTFGPVIMHGVTARRRVIHYGFLYSFHTYSVMPGPPVPEFLLPFRDLAAGLMEADPADLREVLITEYASGAGIGWHRDAPVFGRVAGISLAANCRMRFRRPVAGGWEKTAIVLEPRSAYLLRGAARSVWQHSIAAVDAPRYSITFRTLREPRRHEDS